MPKSGKIITNPFNGNSYEFIDTAEETLGEHVLIKATIRSKGPLVPNHIHVHQKENFTVLEGRMTIWMDGMTNTLSAGEQTTLPRNQAHNHYNMEDTPLVYLHKVSPALDFDLMMENLLSLAAEGKFKRNFFGMVQQMVFLNYFKSVTYIAGIPIRFQKWLADTVDPIARKHGYRAVYRKYSIIER